MTLTTEEIRANLLAWIRDLETTDAKQGRVNLRSLDDKYCCLGRACVVAKWPWVRSPIFLGFDAILPSHCEDDHTGELLPTERREAGELTDEAREHFGLTGGEQAHLITLNDDEGQSFREIAAWLRENVLPRYTPTSAVEQSLTEPVA